MTALATTAEFPEKMSCIFQPQRYKVFWGGRGAGRSWGCARALLLLGTKRAIRVLCVRELQNSIGESVHKVLSDQLDDLGLSQFYDIQKAVITGRNGTTFSFEGIKNNTTKIKSYEGIDYCWVEEANKVSKASWNILIPTIRNPGSEIWITFNPELESDYTYQRFVQSPSEDSFVVKMTWKDNPWFPEVLRKEKDDLALRDPDEYLNVWEGNCKLVLEGAVYAKEMRRAREEGRISRVPWDRDVPVDTFWDLGRADKTAIWFAQRVGMQYRVLRYFEDFGEDIHYYLRYCQSLDYTYGQMHLPHDAKAKRLGSKRTIEEIVRGVYQVRIVPKLSVTDGINAARMIFPNCWFDEAECTDGLACLAHYRYEVTGQRDDKTPIYGDSPIHDWASDGADAFRYMAVDIKSGSRRAGGTEVGRKLAELTEGARRKISQIEPNLNWMR